jgi:hypothetical protein
MCLGWSRERGCGKSVGEVKVLRNPTVLTAVLLLAATFPHTAQAVLWKTEAELTTQYGEPVEISRDLQNRTFTYQIEDLKLKVQFQDGLCQQIWYQHEDRTKPFSPEEIESLLEENSGGKAWHRGNEVVWELGSPAVATASMSTMEGSTLADGKNTPWTYYTFDISTVAYEQKEMEKAMEPYEPRSRTGAEKHFEGILELRAEEDDNQVAIVRDGKSVLEIPWAWRGHPGRAKLETGQTYEITLRDEELVDIDAPAAFVSDRVHKSHKDRVDDSEFFALVRIKHAGAVIFDESVCEVHKTPMQRTKAEIAYGMIGPGSEADAVCEQKYPHHIDWIRGGCMGRDAQTAFHYVCPECVAATAKYKREHPDEAAPYE